MAGVTIRGLVKEFGRSRAVDDVDLEVHEGEFVTLLGPSGCGKTTTLRCLAGLEVPTAGDVAIGSSPVFSSSGSLFVPPDKRHVGMVFQSYALWPHMTVEANVAYPLKLAKVDKREARQRARAMLELVGLGDRVGHMAVSLSGGQQQRVALARAMVNNPSLLLFDEPLSNLDAKLRMAMRVQIRELHDATGTTSVYVTHDQEEAMALADRVVVMNQGRIKQVGHPRELYSAPRSAFVADFMGFQNIVDAHVVSVGSDGYVVTIGGATRLRVAGRAPGPVDTPLQVAFRASHVKINDDRIHEPAIEGVVRTHTYLGTCVRMQVDVGGVVLRTQVDESEFLRFGPDDLSTGASVALRVPPSQVLGLPSGERTAIGAAPADLVHLSKAVPG